MFSSLISPQFYLYNKALGDVHAAALGTTVWKLPLECN